MPTGTATIKDFAGVNLDVSPRDIADNELAYCLDGYSYEPGIISTRPQFRFIRQVLTLVAPGTYGPKARLFSFIDGTNRARTLVWGPSDGTNPGQLLEYLDVELNSTFGTTYARELKSIGPTRYRPDFVVHNRQCYISFGDGNGVIRLAAIDTEHPLNITEMSGVWGSASVAPALMSLYRNTLMLLGFEGTEESSVRMCEPADPNTRVSDSKIFFIGDGDGDTFTGAREIFVAGGGQFVESYWLVFKKLSMWMVTGNPPTTTDTGSLKIVKVNPREGCIAKETIVDAPAGLIWCSGQNVWALPNGGAPVAIGGKIAKHLRNLPQSAEGHWHAVYHPSGFYKLTVPSAEMKSSSATEPPTEQWWCDVRNGFDPEKVKWWGPMYTPGLTASWMQQSVGSEASKELVVYAGASHLHILEGHTQTADHTDHFSAGIIPPGSYALDWRFKEFTFGDSRVQKIIEGTELYIHADKSGYALISEWRANGGVKRITNSKPQGRPVGPGTVRLFRCDELLGTSALVDANGGTALNLNGLDIVPGVGQVNGARSWPTGSAKFTNYYTGVPQASDYTLLHSSNAFSLAAWVKIRASDWDNMMSANPLDDYARVILTMGAGLGTPSYFSGLMCHLEVTRATADGRFARAVRFIYEQGTPGAGVVGVFDSTAVLPFDVWTRVFATFDGASGVGVMYFNGVAVTTVTGLPPHSGGLPNAYLAVGCHPHLDVHFFKGALDEIFIANRIYSAAEVLADYERDLAPDDPGFTLGVDVLGSGDSSLLADGMYVVAVAPSNGERFLVNTFQPILRMNRNGEARPVVKLSELGIKFRPVGRRPTL